jgi:hypothetical protein
MKSDGSSDYATIPPEGWILDKVAFSFKQINISNRKIYFKTERIKGVSYKFTGYFPIMTETEKNNDDSIWLKGNLIKMKNDKKVAEVQVKFGYTLGC